MIPSSTSERDGLSLQGLIGQIRAYAPTADLSQVEKAFALSARAHAGQKRKSGEPYLIHPLGVAEILAELRMDLPSIVAGLLHDVLEDTPCTREEIEHDFGPVVASLVDGVTKIGQISFRSTQEKQAENFRKMIVCMAEDLRVLLIKLSDRLYNMRTLSSLTEERQRQIAQETLDIYAPLANRLGLGSIKAELEELCFHALEPEACARLSEKIADEQAVRERYIQSVIQKVEEVLGVHHLSGRVIGRSKHLFSVHQKIQKRGVPFEEIYDLMGVRILTGSMLDCYAILGLVHALWLPVPGRFKDYIAIPKSNLYQSLHTTVVGPQGRNVEFQIRTEEMHRLAEEGVAAHWVYKEGGPLKAKDEKAFAWLRQLLEWQRDIPDTLQFMNSVKTDLFTESIYVFTPKGDVRAFAHDATPIDFAYAIHTDVGHHCMGAKVNGRIVPLVSPLKNGDRVEILTSPTHRPSKDWLKAVKTSLAKSKIKRFLVEQERARSLQIGRQLLERALRRERMSPTEVFKSDTLLAGVKDAGIRSLDDLFVAVGYGKISVAHLLHPLSAEPALKEKIVDKIAKKLPFGGGRVCVQGISGLSAHLAKCCGPLPGDPIVGFVTRGMGLTIHTTGCPNIDRLSYDRERIVEEVEWGDEPMAQRVGIIVHTLDRPGILAQVSASISALGVDIKRADIRTSHSKKGELFFQIEVADTQHLAKTLRNIEKVSGVLDVKRVWKGW